MNKKNVVTAIFFLYLILLFYLLLFQDRSVLLSDSGQKVYIYNIIPFKEIHRFMTSYDILGWAASLVNILGNILIFMPLGFLFPMVSQNKKGYMQIFINAFLLSFLVEIVQLVLAIGSFDIDDLILNTGGAILGFALYRIMVAKKGK